MNPQNLGFGSGSPMIGGGGQVAQQIQNGAPALNQMGANAPGMVPGQQMQPTGLPQGAPPPMAMMPHPMQPPQPQAAPAPQASPKTEGHLIIEALTNRLKAIGELEHRLHDLTEHIAGMPPKQDAK